MLVYNCRVGIYLVQMGRSNLSVKNLFVLSFCLELFISKLVNYFHPPALVTLAQIPILTITPEDKDWLDNAFSYEGITATEKQWLTLI